MADITTRIRLEADIDILGERYAFLKDANPDSSIFKDWHYKYQHNRGYKDIKQLNIIFIGQTGYGKSSLINTLVGKDVFETSDYESCTKILQSADFFLHHKYLAEKRAYTLSFVDLPGIGESDKSDTTYLQWYQEYIKESALVLYLFRADKRDHAQDEFFFEHVFDKDMKNKLICLLSQADKIEPISRGGSLSTEQLENIEKKKQELKSKPFLSFYSSDIIHVSTAMKLNIDAVHDRIVSKLKEMLKQ